MKNSKGPVWVICLLLASLAPAGCALFQSEDRANEPFYRSSKPLTRWWWFASEIQKEDVEHQLEWLAENNFGGVEIAFIYPEGRDPEAKRFEWLCPKWREAVAHAKQTADRLELDCDFTFGTLWPFGGTFVTDADRTRVFGDPEFKQDLRLSWTHPVIGNVVNHMDKEAFERYASVMGAGLKDALQGSRSGLFCDSWEVETKRIWTEEFGEAFEQRYGYDIRPSMEQLYDEDHAGERYDYMKLVSETVIDNFYRPFTETCHALGAFSRVQCSGSPTDLLTAYAAADVPESEAMLFEPPFSTIPASAALLAGRPLVTSETFTCLYGFPGKHLGEEQTADLKLVADALFANGVNQIIWHGMPFNSRGSDGNRFYATVHVGESGALAKDLKEFNRYLEKVSGFMQRGRTWSDVAVYLPLEDAWIAGEYPEELQFPWAWGAYELRYVRFAEELSGHRPLWVNQRFLEEAELVDGVLNCGDARFTSLYVDVTDLDSGALDTILDLAKKGLPVCLKKRPGEAGRNKSADFASRLDELASLPAVSSRFAAVAARPPLVAGENLPDHWCRTDGEMYTIFFAHPSAKDLHLPLTLGQAQSAGLVEMPVVISVGGKSRKVDLKFEPGQSLLLEIDAAGQVRFVDITYQP
ncbi:MAG: glycosyl hydrolase [Planctomycetota bacterium]